MPEGTPDYSTWTLEQLEAENNRLWEMRQALKARQMEIVPYLEAAHKNRQEEAAAQADPALTQIIGGEPENG